MRQESGPGGTTVADFTHLPTHCRFIALMPQWDFLDFLAERGKQYPTFHLMMRAKVTGLVEEGDRVAGVRAETPEGPLTVRSTLVVGADGRHSTVREGAGLKVQDVGAPIDVLWMRLPRHQGDPEQPAGWFDRGRILVMLDRGDYWQCAFVIPKGGYEAVRQRGLDALRADIAAIAPFVHDRISELRDWDDIKLLTVVVDRLRRWCRPGLLCIGDAAHAMSPVGGVGINLAIQDAVAAANLLAIPLREGRVTTNDLRQVQRRRELPTRLTQQFQVFVQDRVLTRVLRSRRRLRLPLPLRIFRAIPAMARIPARLIGIGVRAEHVRSPDVRPTR
jgi:2-polyprenyl-6-methoxyphenol hydroxylase-like FAD-dependent oxidoreductase